MILTKPPMMIATSPSVSSVSSFKKPETKKVVLPSEAPKKSSTTRGVTFRQRVKVRKIRSYKLFTDQEKKATWYTPEEYNEIRSVCVKTIKMMQKEGKAFTDCDEYTSRGLEVRTLTGLRRRKATKKRALNAVLDEQDYQEEIEEYDDEKLRSVYREVSSVSQNVAEFVAACDRENILDYMQESSTCSNCEPISH